MTFNPLLSIIDSHDDRYEGTYTLSDKVFMIKISNSKLTTLRKGLDTVESLSVEVKGSKILVKDF